MAPIIQMTPVKWRRRHAWLIVLRGILLLAATLSRNNPGLGLRLPSWAPRKGGAGGQGAGRGSLTVH